MPLLLVLSACSFIGGLVLRFFDPLVPEVARDLAAAPEAVALLVSAFMLPYALSQPFIGAFGDTFGKARIIKICLATLALTLALMALAPTFEWLALARVVGGMFGGGVFPLTLAIVGDRFAFAERQVALGKLITAVISAQLLGNIAAGLIASVFGWRVVMWLVALITLGVFLVAAKHLKPRPDAVRRRLSLSRLQAGYLEILQDPRALACYGGVFVNGIVVMGLLPYVAVLLEARGAGGLREAGFVLAGMGLGGFLYTFNVRTLLGLTGGVLNMLRLGGLIAAAGLFAIAFAGPWPVEMAAFVVMGVGFYTLHASLQTQATEISPQNRAACVAMHAFFFILGQAVGPVVYGIALAAVGPTASILGAGVIMGLLGLAAARLFERSAKTDTTG